MYMELTFLRVVKAGTKKVSMQVNQSTKQVIVALSLLNWRLLEAHTSTAAGALWRSTTEGIRYVGVFCIRTR